MKKKNNKVEYILSDYEENKINSINLIKEYNKKNDNLSLSSENNVQRIYKNNLIIYGKRIIYPLEYQEKNLKRICKSFI